MHALGTLWSSYLGISLCDSDCGDSNSELCASYIALAAVVRFIWFIDAARLSYCCKQHLLLLFNIKRPHAYWGTLEYLYLHILYGFEVNIILYIRRAIVFCFIAFMVKSWHIFFLAHAFTGAP